MHVCACVCLRERERCWSVAGEWYGNGIVSSIQSNFIDWSHYDDITGNFWLDNRWFQCMYTWEYPMSSYVLMIGEQ